MNNLAKLKKLTKYITEWYNIIDDKQTAMIIKLEDGYSYSLVLNTIIDGVLYDDRFYDSAGIIIVPVSYDSEYVGIRSLSYNNIKSLYVNMNAFNDNISVKNILNALFNEENIDALEELIIDNYKSTLFDLSLLIKDNLIINITSIEPITQIIGAIDESYTSINITLNNSKITSLANAFKERYKLQHVKLNFDMKYVTDISNIFRSDEELLDVSGLINLRSLQNADYAFYNCRKLLNINLLDCKNVTSAINTFLYCNSVVDFDGVKDITIDLDISSMDDLTKNSISKVISNLGVCNGERKTLTLHRYAYNMLSSYDKKYIIDKNWRIISSMINGMHFSKESILDLYPEELEIMYVSEDGCDVNGIEDAVVPYSLITFRGECQQIHNFVGTIFYIRSKYRSIYPKYDLKNKISLYDDVNKIYLYVNDSTDTEELYVISDETGFDIASSKFTWQSHDVSFNLYKDEWVSLYLTDGSFKYIKNSKYDHIEIINNKGRLTYLDFNDLYITNLNFINLFKDCTQLTDINNLQVVHGALLMTGMFSNCKNLTSINGIINIDNVISTRDAFKNCISLENFDGIRKLHCNLNMQDCANLSNESVYKILTLAEKNNTRSIKTILLNENVYNKLNPATFTLADNKLWNISKDHIINPAIQLLSIKSAVIKTNAFIPCLANVQFELTFAISSLINKGNLIFYYIGSNNLSTSKENAFIIKIINDGISKDFTLQIQICSQIININQKLKLYELYHLTIYNNIITFNNAEYKFTPDSIYESSLPIYIGSLNLNNSVVGGDTFLESIKVRIIDMIIYNGNEILNYITPFINDNNIGLKDEILNEKYSAGNLAIYVDDSEIYDNTLICGYYVNGNLYMNYSYVTNILFNGTASILAYGFYGCTGIEEITIPQTMYSINNYAFMNCANLKTVKIEQTNPTLLSISDKAFIGCHKDLTIYVKKSPDHSIIEMFRKYWTYYANIIKEY